MSKTLDFFKENFADFQHKLNVDIDTFPDLSTFKKLKAKLDSESLIKIISFLSDDFTKSTEILPLFYILKSLIAIIGLKFVFLLLKEGKLLVNVQILCISQQTKSVFIDIVAMISEKIKELRDSGLELEELKTFSQLKPLSKALKVPKFSGKSSFEEIYLKGFILHKKIQAFFSNNKGNSIEKNGKIPEFLKELDNYQYKLLDSLNTNISASDTKLLSELTKTNKLLKEELNKNREFPQGKPQLIRGPPLYKRTFFKRNESLPLENMEIEYKNYYFPLSEEQMIKLECCISAFLNANGGRIFLGVKDEGNKVVGIKVNSPKKKKEVEGFIHIILSHLSPELNENQSKIIFLPIKNEFNLNIKGLYVVKIIIRKGEKFLYSTSEGRYFKRRDGKVKMLHPDELKQELDKRAENPMSFADQNEDFDDPEPAKEEYINDFAQVYDNFETMFPQNFPPKNNFNNVNNVNNYNGPPLYQKVYIQKSPMKYKPQILNNEVKKIKDFNKKVICLKVMDQIEEKKIMMDLILIVKNVLVNVFSCKVVKIIQRFEKKCGFFELENEGIFEQKDEVFGTINDNIQGYGKKKIEIFLEFAEKERFEKYEKKMIKIK